jgi:penicillin V acylase-like amidase (Ntn superfamily)
MKLTSNPIRLTLVALGLSTAVFQAGLACTTAAIPKSAEKIVAKSYDWRLGHGMAVANLKGIKKSALRLDPSDTPAEWISKYGSLTFNQNGREFPLGGMNEKGLVVEIMWLDSTLYPTADSRPAINELQWIQYQLDNYETVQEVVSAADSLRVSQAYALVHYLVCDASGACATFENLDGKMVVHSGADLKAPTLTNNTYKESMKYLSYFEGFGGRSPMPTDSTSLQRFTRASMLAAAFDPKGSVSAHDAGFKILDSVGGTNYSKFHIVYDPTNKVVRFRTLSKRSIKTVDIKQWDFLCAKDKDRALMYDMNAAGPAADVTSQFKPFGQAENLKMIKAGLKDIEGSLPPKMAERLAAYPAQLPCL